MSVKQQLHGSRRVQASLDAVPDHSITVEEADRPLSIADTRTIQTAGIIAVGYHLLLVALFAFRVPLDLFEYWIFIFVDTVLWVVALIPLIAIGRKRLIWYDLFALLAMLFFGMICTFSLAYSIDPSIIQFVSSYGGSALRDSTQGQFLAAVVKAELVLLAFSAIVLYLNRFRLIQAPSSHSRIEYQAATLTALFWAIGGIIGFRSYWSSRSFLHALTTEIGSLELKAVEVGAARYVMLVDVALMALPLGIIGLIGILSTPRRGHVDANVLMVVGVMIAVLVNLWNGARVDVLFAFLAMITTVAYFGIRTRASTWGAMLVIMTVVIGFVTIVRGNPDVASDPKGILNDVLSGNAVSEYASQSDVRTITLLALDRVAAVAMTTEYLRLTNEYLYGETIVAGPARVFDSLISRFSSSTTAAANQLRTANEVTFYWRYGYFGMGTAVPPSIPGEFLMQAGVAVLLVASLLFGWFMLWLRRRITVSTLLIGRWSLITLGIIVVKALPTELSVVTSKLVYTLLPVIVLYAGIYIVLTVGQRRGHGSMVDPFVKTTSRRK